MDPLTMTLWILGISIAVAFINGLVTRNYSTVDRLWSILPAVYVLVWMPSFLGQGTFVLPAVVVVLWAIRLTVNFAVKGGYRFSLRRGFYEEDYRWPVLKQKIPNRFLFELFNLSFISFFQLALVFGFTLPLYYLGTLEAAWTTPMLAVLAIHVLLLVTETVADLQQLAYYRRRGDERFAADPVVALGFNTRGLWKWSRHPNYVCEMGQWICVSLYLHLAAGAFHWSGVFALVLVALFMGSTLMAERITTAKYPAYADWKRATPPWIPFVDWPLRQAGRRAFSKKWGAGR